MILAASRFEISCR